MRDYQNISIGEATNKEIIEQFIREIKLMDSKQAQIRLESLINSSAWNISFTHLAAQFNSLIECKTSAD